MMVFEARILARGVISRKAVFIDTSHFRRVQEI